MCGVQTWDSGLCPALCAKDTEESPMAEMRESERPQTL